MPLTEMDSPDGGYALDEITYGRVSRRLKETLANVGAMHRLPRQVLVVIYDKETEERIGAVAKVDYPKEEGATSFTITMGPFGILKPEVTIAQEADDLLECCPGLALVCDETIAGQLAQNSVSWLEEEGHYRLQGMPNGILEVFVPYETYRSPDEFLPPDIVSRFFIE